MSERDWKGELERYLQNSFAEQYRAIGQPVPLSGLRINPALGLEESKYFLLGLETGLFQLDKESYVQSELLPAPSEGNTRQEDCRLFCHEPLSPRFFRESVCQLATVSLLIFKRGWLKSHLLMESNIQGYRSPTDKADIMIRSITGELLVCVEVKRSVAELQKLITDLRHVANEEHTHKATVVFPKIIRSSNSAPCTNQSIFGGSRLMLMSA